MMPARLIKRIVLVENKATGSIRPAHLISAPVLGDDVWRGKVFKRYDHVIGLEEQDLHDIAKAMEITIRTKAETADILWFRMNKATAVYDENGFRHMVGDEKMVKKAAKQAKEGKLPTKRGRKNDNAGKKIFVKAEGNPRRVGSHGYKSFSLYKNGMALEEFLAAGGRAQDLRSDIEHKYVELK